MPEQSRSIAVVVAGMPRSGTSAMAGALGLLGLRVPSDTHPGTLFNEKGYFESTEFISILDELLASQHSSELDWRPMRDGWIHGETVQHFIDRGASAIARAYRGAPQIVLKNPRISKLIPFMDACLSQAGYDPRYLLMFRNPVEVERSEAGHHGSTLRQAELAWLRYTLDGEAATRHHVRAFVNYAELLDDWHEVLEKTLSRLSVILPGFGTRDAQVSDFISADLRHHIVAQDEIVRQALTHWASPTFAEMLALSNDPYDGKAQYRLTEIRDDFNRATEVFQPLVRPVIASLGTNQPSYSVDPLGQEKLRSLLIRLEQERLQLEASVALHEGLQVDLLASVRAASEKVGALEGALAEAEANSARLLADRQSLKDAYEVALETTVVQREQIETAKGEILALQCTCELLVQEAKSQRSQAPRLSEGFAPGRDAQQSGNQEAPLSDIKAAPDLTGRLVDPQTSLIVLASPKKSIAVIICCYSGEPFYQDAVNSLIAQTSDDFDIVFHDNGCHPSYSRAIQRTSDEVGGIVFRSTTNRYGEGLRYDVLPHLRHEYIAILHDDDVYKPAKIERALRAIKSRDLDYLFTARTPLDSKLHPLARSYDAINVDPISDVDFPHRYIAELFYKGIRLHFSTLVIKTELARQNLLGDPYLPRIADALFFSDLLLDSTLKGIVLPQSDTLVRIHGGNDFLYEKFEPQRRGSEMAQLSLSEFLGFQRVLAKASDSLLGDILAIFPGITVESGDSRVMLLVKAGLAFRPWMYGKRLIGLFCLHSAFQIDGFSMMAFVRKLTGRDANVEVQELYSLYIDELRNTLE